MKYAIQTTIEKPFEGTLALVREAIARSGFGTVSEINLEEKLQGDLGVSYPRYKILGACNPKFSYKAVQEDDNVGLLLPCNVLVKEKNGSTTEVSAVDPSALMSITENAKIEAIAAEIKQIMQQIIRDVEANAA